MEDKIIDFTTALLAKEKGFNVPTLYFYMDSELKYNHSVEPRNNNIIPGTISVSAPTQSLLQRWLREVHEISIHIDDFYTDSKLRFDYAVGKIGSQEDNPQGVYETYEEALEAALYQALLLANQKL